MKRIIFFLCTLWLTASSLWAQTFEVDSICYKIIDKVNMQVEVTTGSPKNFGKVVIPANVTYNETTYSVTKIGKNAFSQCRELSEVFIPYGVTIIGEFAFYNCTSLASINIPYSVTTIEDHAFHCVII